MTAYRLKGYQEVMEIIQMLMLRTTDATINNFKAHCKVAPVATATVTRTIRQRHRLLQSPSFASAAQATMSFTWACDTPTVVKWPHHQQFWTLLTEFWQQIIFAPTNEQQQGFTWMEMLVLFELRKGEATPRDLNKPNASLQPLELETTTHTLLHHFRLM